MIKLTAQIIIGRIRTEDLASRLHGDEYAIFISNTNDYNVAKKIMEDINRSIEKEAAKRNMPSITVSAGAVTAKHGDSFAELSKVADEALYRAKETHNGGFALGCVFKFIPVSRPPHMSWRLYKWIIVQSLSVYYSFIDTNVPSFAST